MRHVVLPNGKKGSIFYALGFNRTRFYDFFFLYFFPKGFLCSKSSHGVKYFPTHHYPLNTVFLF